MATQYPLQSKAFIWPISALLVLKRLAYSALFNRAKLNTLSTCRMFTGFGTDKTIESQDKALNNMLCNPHGYLLSGLCCLFNLNTKTAANDATYNNRNERKVA